MDGGLFSRSSPKTGGGGRNLARPLPALGGRPKKKRANSASALSGHKHLSSSVQEFGEQREQRQQQQPQQQQAVADDHGGCHSPRRTSFEGRLPVVVVSCLNDALNQIPVLRSAPLGTCTVAVIAATSHGQPADDKSQNPTPGIKQPPLVLQPPTGVLDAAKESVNNGTILCEQIDGIRNTRGTVRWGVWGCHYPWRGSVARSERCGARLGILCKFPGAVIECPLTGRAFELKEINIDDAPGEDFGTRETIPCAQKNMCWTLPSRGFEALQDVQTRLCLGVSALAREMANDSSCTREGLASAEKLARTFANEDRTYVVAPDVTGLYFFWTAAIGFKDKSTVRVTVARFEGTGGSNGVQQCLRLEDYDSFEAALRQGSVRTGKPICKTGTKRSARYLTLPATYDTLLREATTAQRAAGPGKGSSITWKMWRWHRDSRYTSASTRIVPGIGEDSEYIHNKNTRNANEIHPPPMSEQKGQGLERLEANGYGMTTRHTNEVPAAPKALTSSGLKPDTEDNANVHEVCVHEENRTTSEIEGVDRGLCWKTNQSAGTLIPDGAFQTTEASDTPCLHDVQTASRQLAITWASNRGIAREILAHACQGEDREHEATWACERENCEGRSHNGARDVACALLAKAVVSGAGLGADGHDSRHQQLCENQTSILLDAWYEEFWIAAASLGGDQSFLSQHSLLLLDGMLRIPDVRGGFLQRGLLRRLADGMAVLVEANWSRLGEVSIGEPTLAYGSPNVVGDSSRVRFTNPDSALATKTTTEEDGVEGDVVGHVCTSSRALYKCTATQTSSRINLELKQDGGCHDPEQWNTILRWLLTSVENGRMREAEGADGEGEGENGGDGAETDAGSCKTASDGGFVPVDSDLATSRAKSALDDLHSLKSNILNVSDAFVGEESRGQGKPAGRGGRGQGNARERAMPPRLRLDVLRRDHRSQEWSSPPSSRRGAMATLSAASTRASTHMPTFRSTRGATSRASARRQTGGCNGGGGSERTARTTQRSSCCCSPLPPAGGSLSPPQSPDERESSLASGLPLQGCHENATINANWRVSMSSNSTPDEADSISKLISVPNRLSSRGEGTHWEVPRGGQQSTTAKNASHGDSSPTGVRTCDASEGTADDVASSAEAGRVGAGSANNHCGGKRAVPLLRLACLPTSATKTTVEEIKLENPAHAIKCGQFETSNSITPAESVISTGVDCNPTVLDSAADPAVIPGGLSRLPDEVERHVAAEFDTDPRGVSGGVVVTGDCTVGDVVEPPPTAWPLLFGGRMSGVWQTCEGDERTATALVLSIACASKPSPQRRTSCKPIGALWYQVVATAELVLSLLAAGSPLADDDGMEAAIVASLSVFSCIGVRSSIAAFAASFAPASGRLASGVAMSSAGMDKSEGRAEDKRNGSSSAAGFSAETVLRESVWLKDFERVDLALLLRGIQAHPANRMSSSPPKSCSYWLNQAASHASFISVNEPCYHRHRVSKISRLSLERAWLARLLLRRIFATCQLNLNLPSGISADAIGQVLDFCAGTLKKQFLNPCCHFPRSSDGDDSTTNKSHVALASESTIDPIMLLFEAPTAVELVTLLKGAVRFPATWGDNVLWAVATLRSRALSEVGHVGAVPVLVALVDRLMTTLTADEGTPSRGTVVHDALKYLERRDEQGDGRGECKSWQKLPTARALVRMLGGSLAAVDELLVRVLESLEAFLSRCATLLNMYLSAPLPTSRSQRQTAASLVEATTSGRDRLASTGGGGSEWIAPDDTRRRQGGRQSGILQDLHLEEEEFSSAVPETVSQMLAVVSPLFQPKGSILAILHTPRPSSHFDGIFKGNEAVDQKKTLEYNGQIGNAVVASTLRLSTVFFSLWAESDRTCRIFRPENYAEPLFEGFVRHLGAVSDTGVGGETASHQGMPDETDTRTTARDTEESKTKEPGNMLLCQRYLGALVALTAIPDTHVRQVMHEQRVAQFLICEVLAAGQTTTSPSTAATGCNPQQKLVELAATIPGSGSERGGTVGVTDPCPVLNSPVIEPIVVSAATDATAAPTNRSEQTCGGDCSASNGRDQSKCASSPRSVALVKADATPYRATMGVGQKCSFENAKHCDSGGPGRAGPPGEGASSIIAEGDRIDGLVSVRSGGRPRWFPGRVVKVNKDGTMHICYDDGDEETRKDRANIRSERERARPPRSGAGRVNAKESNKGPPVTREEEDKGVLKHEESSPSRMVGKLEDAVEISKQSYEEPQLSESEYTESIGNVESVVYRASSSGISSIAGVESSEAVVQNVAVPGTIEVRCDDLDDNGNILYDRRDGDNHDKNDSEEEDEEDMYFEIPRVIIGVEPAAFCVEPRVFPTSTVPRIDLQSPFFGPTTIRSTQLGPGSSLSTPTTGRSANRRRGRGGSSSDGALQVLCASDSIMRSLRPSLIAARMSGHSPMSISCRGPSSVLPSSMLLSARSVSGSASTSGKGESCSVAVTQRTKDNEACEETSGASGRFDEARQDGTMPMHEGAGETEGGVAATTGSSANASNPMDRTSPKEGPSFLGKRQNINTSRLSAVPACVDTTIQEGAVALLLTLSATAGDDRDLPATGDIYQTVVPASRLDERPQEVGGQDLEADGMMFLRTFFDDPENVHLVSGLGTLWRGRSSTPAKPTTEKSAILAKLTCRALFDERSYNLVGDHMETGMFGGVLVSRSPLPLEVSSQREKRTSRGTGTRHKIAGEASPFEVRSFQEVALKVIETDEFDRAIGPNVHREVLALRALADVVGVCRLYDFGLTSTSYVLVLEGCLCSLKSWRLGREGVGNDDDTAGVMLAKSPSSDPEVLLYLLIFRQIAAAVAAMAAHGVIHFDLKCDNVLVRGPSCCGDCSEVGPVVQVGGQVDTRVPSVCVADFGEAVVGYPKPTPPSIPLPVQDACVIGSGEDEPKFEFRVRRARGTERIQSPEMLLWASGRGGSNFGCSHLNGPGIVDEEVCVRGGAKNTISTATDVWSLGCLLYELLSGKLLFELPLWSEFFVMLTTGETPLPQATPDTRQERGKHQAQEAYEANDSHAEQWKKSSGTTEATTKQQPTPLPPASSMEPLAALGSAETLRKLLESMLVRDPTRRPSASDVVVGTGKAISTVAEMLASVPCSGNMVDGLCLPAEVAPRTPKERESGETASSTEYKNFLPFVSKKTTRSKVADEIPYVGCNPPAKEDSSDNAYVAWSIQPCDAVGLERAVAIIRSIKLGCEGYVSRLAAGAFLVTLQRSRSGSNRVEGCPGEKYSDDEGNHACFGNLHESPRKEGANAPHGPKSIRSDTLLCAIGDTLRWRSEGVEGAVSLGTFLPALGITHVVCVTTGREDGNRQEGSHGYNESSPSATIQSVEGFGPRLMHVYLPVDWSNDNASTHNCHSGASEMNGVVSDVMAFATRSRALFVGEDEDGGAAGAMAMAWAINRTGKSAYEVMLEFRKSCNGFWVEPSVLKAVLG